MVRFDSCDLFPIRVIAWGAMETRASDTAFCLSPKNVNKRRFVSDLQGMRGQQTGQGVRSAQ